VSAVTAIACVICIKNNKLTDFISVFEFGIRLQQTLLIPIQMRSSLLFCPPRFKPKSVQNCPVHFI
jgi:hypothetical protein